MNLPYGLGTPMYSSDSSGWMNIVKKTWEVLEHLECSLEREPHGSLCNFGSPNVHP